MRGVGKYFKNKAGLKSINTNQIICSSNMIEQKILSHPKEKRKIGSPILKGQKSIHQCHI